MSAHDQSAITDRVVEWLQDSIVTIDLAGIITSWNRAAQALYGYSALEAIGKPLSMLILPEDIAQLMSNIDTIRNGGVVQLYDTMRITKEGKEIHLEIRLSPLKDGQGKVSGVITLARDVTEVRKIQFELARSEARLRTLSDVIPQLVWESDSSGRAINFNKRWFEFSCSTWHQSVGPGWQSLIHPRDAPALRAWETAFKARQMFECEVRLRRHDGVYRWHLLRNIPYSGIEGEPDGWFGSATDVHDLHEAQSLAEEQSHMLNAVLEAAIDFAIIIVDDFGIIIGWNSGAQLMFGYSRDEVIGKSTAIIFTPEDRQAEIHLEELRTAREQGRSLDERWHLHKDGTRFFMSGVMVSFRHGSIARYVKIARNITDRKLTEEALFLTELRKSIVQSAEIGEWYWDIQTDTTEISEQSGLIFGVNPRNAIAGPFLLNHIYPDDRPHVEQVLNVALGGLNIFHAEFRIIRTDDKAVKWVSAYGRVVAHENEAPKRMLGVIYDITKRKLLESQKDDFISIASHELRTPVASIKAYSGVLQEVLEEVNHAESVEIVRKLNMQVERLVRLIHRLLDATNEEGKMMLMPQTFDLNVLAEECVQELHLISARHQLLWQPGNIGLVHADKDRIGQVITNFITNAVKFSPGKEKVIISTENAIDGAILAVQDFGIGLTSDERKHVFERYFRAKNTSIAIIPGIGLGLHISAEIIRQHSGDIWVESVEGKGSTFKFKLPYS